MADIITVQKPWGEYQDIYRTENVVFKKIIIRPNEAISYQVHQKRTECWYVHKGQGIVKTSDVAEPNQMKNYRIQSIEKFSFILVPPGMPHQIENNGEEDLIIYEMQCGECNEEDIVRLEDRYGRAN